MIKFVQVNNLEGGRTMLRLDTILGYSEARGKLFVNLSDGTNADSCEIANSYDELTALIKEAQE